MNRIYARMVLSTVTGEKYDFSEDLDTIDTMSAELEKAYNAGRDSANSGLLPDNARRMWESAHVSVLAFDPLDVHILTLEEEERVRYVPIIWRKTENGEIDTKKYDCGSYWKTPGAAVVEALSMRRDLNDAVMGQAANKLMDLE